ncbi:MAG: PAS domain S-box protein [Ignavibacteriales bacterium]|nr:MAG: PAS domain S-box protein [Ignavibacteriales bacterium]
MCNRIKIKILAILIITLLIDTQLLAQSQSFLITKYSTDNGLPDNRVNDIAQDSLGRIWVAMASGIAMYDGYEWIKIGKKNGVPEIEYIKIKIDEKGVMWFLPKDIYKQKLVYCVKNNWKYLQFPEDVIVKSNHCNSMDIRYRTCNPEIFISTINQGLIKYFDKKWSKITSKSGLISDSISCVLNISNKIYISTYSGISIINENGIINNYDFHDQKIDRRILSIARYNNNVKNKNALLLLSGDWIGEFCNGVLKKWDFEFKIPFWAMNDPSSIIFNSSGTVLFGNSASIYILNISSRKFEKLILENPHSDRGARSMLLDYEGNFWLSSLRGIYKLSNITFKSKSKSNGLSESEVSAISQFNSGKLFFGHNYGFTTVYKNETLIYNINSSTENKTIYRVLDSYYDKIDDVVYFVSFQKGIGKLHSDGSLTWIDSKKVKNYHSIFKGSKNKIIVCTDKGFGYLSNDKIILFNESTESFVRDWIFINDSTIYLATPTGLEMYNESLYPRFRRFNSANYNFYSIFYSRIYGILLGSSQGLYILKQDSIINFSFSNQQITDPIYFIIQDSVQNIWLGTNNGVLKWDGKNLKRYNKSDGLAGNETNRAAGFVDSKGNVWIGTDEGVSMYTGNEVDYSLYKPKIMILGFEDPSGKLYANDLNVSVDPEKNNLTFHYRGLSFIDEKLNSYQIKLSKVGSKWVNQFSTNSNSARFNNLDYGDYVFSARVKNSKGIWSKWQTSSLVTIRKFYYQEPIFQIGLLSLFLIITYSAYSFTQQKKYTKKLELAVDLRTKDLRDAQVELITSIDRYKGIVDSQTDLVVRVDAAGKFTFVNDAYCFVFGKKREELIGKSFIPLVHPEDMESTIEEMKKLNEPPYRAIIKQRAFTAEGYRWFSWEDYAVHDNNGNIIEIQAVGRDITLQKEVESELEKRVLERTVELQSLISQSPLGIITFSSDGYLLTFNKVANDMFLNLNEYLPPNKTFNIFNDEFLLKNNYKEKLLTLDAPNGFVLSSPIKIDHNKNNIYSNLFNHELVYRIYSVFFDEANKIFVLLLDDVTEHQKSEEISKRLLEERIRISTIIKTIETERDRIAKELHDGIGQLLTTAKLKLDIIKMKSNQNRTEIDDALNILINAGDEIRRIINDLKPSDVESLGLVSSIELLCERIRQSSSINVSLSVSNNFQAKKKKDELVVYRVIQEALNNTIKHSLCKNAGIDISGSMKELNICIWDDGIGVEKKLLNKKKNTFGLNNITERIKSLNGEIEIVTEPGKGFKYLIKIPL